MKHQIELSLMVVELYKRKTFDYMKALLTVLIILVFTIHIASAATFLNIYVENNGDATFLGETDRNVSLPNGIELKDGRIIGSTNNLTKKNGEIWEFSYSLSGAELNLILPEGAIIKNNTVGDIYLDNNKFAVYSKDKIKVSYTIDNSVNSGFPVWMAIVIILFVIAALGYIFRSKIKLPKKTNSANNHLEMIKKVLNEREKLILDKLKNSGKIKSSYLRKLCEMPKASFSRHIQELERKGLIHRSGEGKNKFVNIVD